jgi:hypothetical protein
MTSASLCVSCGSSPTNLGLMKMNINPIDTEEWQDPKNDYGYICSHDRLFGLLAAAAAVVVVVVQFDPK